MFVGTQSQLIKHRFPGREWALGFFRFGLLVWVEFFDSLAWPRRLAILRELHRDTLSGLERPMFQPKEETRFVGLAVASAVYLDCRKIRFYFCGRHANVNEIQAVSGDSENVRFVDGDS